MSKLIKDCVEVILAMAAENELTKSQLTDVLAEAANTFDSMAIIPQKREFSRAKRESQGIEA